MTRGAPTLALFAALAVAATLALRTPAARGDPPPNAPATEAGKAFLDAVRSAGFGGHAVAGGVDLTVRVAPLFSRGMLDVVREGREVEDVARVVLPGPGWFCETAVPGGAYHLGLAYGEKAPLLVLDDASGRRLAARPFWIVDPAEVDASGAVSAADGAVQVSISAGGISLGYRYVPRDRHDAIVSPLATTTSGPVRIHSDVHAPEALERLARSAAASLKVQADLLGVDAPDGPYDLCLVADANAYDRLDSLVTGGAFHDAWAFTSSITRWSYLRYGPRSDDDALATSVLPLKIRALVLHELHHQVAGRACGATCWPDWFAEGLAEVGAERALAAESPADGRAVHDLFLGGWLHADRVGAVPPLADLLGGSMQSGRTGYYTTAYLLVREMASQAKPFAALVSAVSSEVVAPDASIRAGEEAARSFGSLATLLDRVEAAARSGKSRPPAATAGYLDTDGGGWRIVSVPDVAARVVLPAELDRADGARIETTFSFHPSGQQQLDVYPVLWEGRHSEEFLKVAVLPKRIVLFWFRNGLWRNLGSVSYDQPLAVGTATEPSWHTLEVRYQIAAKKLRVELGGGRWAEFDVPHPVPSQGAEAAIGFFNGVGYVKGTKAE